VRPHLSQLHLDRLHNRHILSRPISETESALGKNEENKREICGVDGRTTGGGEGHAANVDGSWREKHHWQGNGGPKEPTVGMEVIISRSKKAINLRISYLNIYVKEL
jgi:hypothetical protein